MSPRRMLNTDSLDLSRKSDPLTKQRARPPPQVQGPRAGCWSWEGCTSGSPAPQWQIDSELATEMSQKREESELCCNAPWEYPLPIQGGGRFLYSSHLAPRLYNVTDWVLLYPINDVCTGMCLQKLGLTPERHKGFRAFDIEEKSRSNICSYVDLMLSKHSFLAAVNADCVIIDKQQYSKKLQKLRNILWEENIFLRKIPDAEEPPIFWSDEPSHSCSLKTTSQKPEHGAGLTTTQPSSLSCAWKPGLWGSPESGFKFVDGSAAWSFPFTPGSWLPLTSDDK
ncbi:hypothetical protein E5288_WYG004949 [Bos mutus]|uniref:Uncharacterized protein n=1 Tax=Bos mutus TaxID=72004 RepID=A0A6B0QXB4_9CETA|nr:hypothetical protein [Bos mutus]